VAALRPGPTRRKITIYGWSTRAVSHNRLDHAGGPSGVRHWRDWVPVGSIWVWGSSTTRMRVVGAESLAVCAGLGRGSVLLDEHKGSAAAQGPCGPSIRTGAGRPDR
jgi:hypothetical protein